LQPFALERRAQLFEDELYTGATLAVCDGALEVIQYWKKVFHQARTRP
jgi:hypothetical protein